MKKENNKHEANNRIIDSYRKLKEGNTGIDQFLESIQLTANNVYNLSKHSGMKAYDKTNIVGKSLEYVQECFEEGEDLRLQAFVIDIYNNLAHAFDKCNDKKNKYKFMEAKDSSIHELIAMCEEQGDKCYGVSKDEETNEDIVVFDIPVTGQISWHLKDEDKGEYAHVKSYPYNYYDKKMIKSEEVDNTRILRNNVTVNEMNLWPKNMREHFSEVQRSFDIEELNENVGSLYCNKIQGKSDYKSRLVEFGEGKDITSKDLENVEKVTSAFKTKEKNNERDR